MIILPYPPSTNHLRMPVRGRLITTPLGRVYFEEVEKLLKAYQLTPLKGPVNLTLWVFRPYKRGDASNRIKVIEDALKGHAYLDDEQVADLHVFRREDPENPRVEVTVNMALMSPNVQPQGIFTEALPARAFVLANAAINAAREKARVKERTKQERKKRPTLAQRAATLAYYKGPKP